MKYGLLHFRGDLRQYLREGQILGHDEEFRPFAVIDADYDADANQTTVQLQTATAEQLKAATA